MKRDKEVKLSVSTGTFVRFWLVILGFIILAGMIWIARGPLIMLAISFFLALVLNRPVSFLARHLPGKSRSIATMISYLIVVAMIGVLLITVVPIFVRQISSFVATVPDTIQQLRDGSGWFTDILARYNLTNQFNNWMTDIQGQLGHWASTAGTSFVSMISDLFSAIGNIFLVMFATFFMLVEAPTWEEKFWRLMYNDEIKREHHKAVARRMYDVVSGYVTGQATVGIISATFTALAVAILAIIFDFDMTLVWPAWITIFMMVFVPMFGAVIGGTVVGLLLAVYSLPAAILYVIIFTIEQQVENNVVQPRIQSKHMDMSALLILIAMTLGLQVGGLLGALVAIPLAGCVVVLARDFFRSRNMDEASARSANHDNNMDGIIGGSAPVIFTEADRRYVGPEIAVLDIVNVNHRRSGSAKARKRKQN